MPSSTPQGPPQDEGDASASQAAQRGASQADDLDTSAQGSGKQFERGTESVPGDDTASTGPAAGPGASASGKRFARGTDSDGDGQTYDQA